MILMEEDCSWKGETGPVNTVRRILTTITGAGLVSGVLVAAQVSAAQPTGSPPAGRPLVAGVDALQVPRAAGQGLQAASDRARTLKLTVKGLPKKARALAEIKRPKGYAKTVRIAGGQKTLRSLQPGVYRVDALAVSVAGTRWTGKVTPNRSRVTSTSGARVTIRYTRARPESSSESVNVVAVGDIASASGLEQQVAAVVAGLNPDKLLLLGDIAYQNGSRRDFATHFAPDWSRFSGIWMPVPGNHEYRTPDAAGYRAFFHVGSGRLYWTERVGAWQVIGLDSESRPGKQVAWLRSTLAATDGRPTLVVWHRPRYSSGTHGDQADTGRFWAEIKDDPDVQLVLWGHDHDYERMSIPVAGRAPVTAMVVGTGGGELRGTPTLIDRPWRDFFVDHTTGVLDLHLESSSFTWSFIDRDGHTLDSGSRALPQATPAG